MTADLIVKFPLGSNVQASWSFLPPVGMTIFWMASKEFWSTRSLKRSTFHLLLSGSKRFEIKKGESWLFGPLGVSLNPFTSMAVLSPTMKHAHLQIRPYNFSITLQRGDAFLISSLPNQSPWNLYLLCKARTHRLSLPETTHQVNLASSA